MNIGIICTYVCALLRERIPPAKWQAEIEWSVVYNGILQL
jgi:hypothetical protein